MSEFLNDSRIVSIGADGSASCFDAQSFDSFDGEFSEARGDRRKRQHARKLERIAMKRQIRKEKGEARGEAQMDRQSRRTSRTGAIQERKKLRSDSRQERKTSRTASGQERRGMKTAGRTNRKQIKNSIKDTKQLNEGQETEEQGYANEDTRAKLPEAKSNETYSEDTETEKKVPSDNVDEEQYDEDQPMTDDSMDDEGSQDKFEDESSEDQFEDEEESSMNGQSIPLQTRDAGKKIVWNTILMNKCKKGIADCSKSLNGRLDLNTRNNLIERRSKLKDLCNGAQLRLQNLHETVQNQNPKLVQMAIREGQMDYKRAMEGKTKVSSDLPATISPNKIVIAANKEGMSNFNGEGDKTSSFTGAQKTNITGIVIGIAVGALAIYAIKKFDLLKKLK